MMNCASHQNKSKIKCNRSNLLRSTQTYHPLLRNKNKLSKIMIFYFLAIGPLWLPRDPGRFEKTLEMLHLLYILFVL